MRSSSPRSPGSGETTPDDPPRTEEDRLASAEMRSLAMRPQRACSTTHYTVDAWCSKAADHGSLQVGITDANL
eukprot:scaffold2905_cov1529-Pavlova_lutheri.AAC.1